MRNASSPTRLARAGIVAGLVLAVGVAPVAVAAPVSPPAAAGLVAPAEGPYYPGPDFYGNASTTKWRQYMLSMTSKVLGDSMPTAWARENAANLWRKSEFNAINQPDGRIPASWGMSADEMANLHGQTSLTRNVNGQLVPTAPRGSGTYDDYVLDNYEKELRGEKPRNGVAAPATKAGTFGKTLVGGTSALSAFLLANQLTSAGVNAVGGWVGLDPNGAVCSQTTKMRDGSSGQDIAADMFNFLSGQDCSAWQLPPEFVPNTDAEGGIGDATGGGVTLRFRAFVGAGSVGNQYWCYSVTGTLAQGYRIEGLRNGVWIQPSGGSWNNAKSGAVWAACSTAGSYDLFGFQNGPNRNSGAVGATSLTDPNLRVVYVPPSGPPSVVSEMKTITTDPERTQTCTVTFTDGTSASSVGEPYKESSGSTNPPQCPATPEGKVPKNVTVTENGSGKTNTLYDEPTTDAFQEWVRDMPECGTGACLLDLVVKQPNNTYASCFDLVEGCNGWFEDPQRTDKYACRYGVKERPIEDCNVYSGLFKPGRVEAGAAYSDPKTGVWSGGQTNTKDDQKAYNTQVQNPAATYRSCTGVGITGFDPIGWVMRPIQCATEWAWVPRPTVVEVTQQQTKLQFETSFPGKLSASITAVSASFSALGAGGCGGLQISLPNVGPDGGNVPISKGFMAACPGDTLAPYAPIVFWAISGFVLIAGLLAVKLQLDRFANNA